jgi:hypothetical protein
MIYIYIYIRCLCDVNQSVFYRMLNVTLFDVFDLREKFLVNIFVAEYICENEKKQVIVSSFHTIWCNHILAYNLCNTLKGSLMCIMCQINEPDFFLLIVFMTKSLYNNLFLPCLWQNRYSIIYSHPGNLSSAISCFRSAPVTYMYIYISYH